MSKTVRAALYARVSTAGHGQDVGLQLDELRQVAAQRRWQVLEYVDEGVSGSQDSRPALDRMMADARVEMDLRPATALLKEGRSLKETARILGVSRNTLRRRLREAGAWPPQEDSVRQSA